MNVFSLYKREKNKWTKKSVRKKMLRIDVYTTTSRDICDSNAEKHLVFY